MSATKTQKIPAASLQVGDTIELPDGRYTIVSKRFKPKTVVFKIRWADDETARPLDYAPHKTTLIRRKVG